MNGFFSKAKQAPEAAAVTQEGIDGVHQRFELSQAYGELGRTAFELIESGAISHARLEDTAAKIRDLSATPVPVPTAVGARVSAYMSTR